MIYFSAFILGIVGGFCAFSEGAFLKKITGQLLILLIFIWEIALAIYAHIKGYSGLLVLAVAIFIGGAIGRILYYFVRNGGHYNFFPSLPKELKQIQRYLAEGGNTSLSNNIVDMMGELDKEELLINRYVQYCYTNMVKATCEKYNLSINDLKDVYEKLTVSGAGQPVNGHYVSLSSITFDETLEFYIRSQNKISDKERAYILLEYFSGKYSSEQLLKMG